VIRAGADAEAGEDPCDGNESEDAVELDPADFTTNIEDPDSSDGAEPAAPDQEPAPTTGDAEHPDPTPESESTADAARPDVVPDSDDVAPNVDLDRPSGDAGRTDAAEADERKRTEEAAGDIPDGPVKGPLGVAERVSRILSRDDDGRDETTDENEQA